ncbi:GntR family transcriptional regulator [Paraburkholderia unamae]|nr:GntR family transcriptional regulator [Paraburkholderia unamae]
MHLPEGQSMSGTTKIRHSEIARQLTEAIRSGQYQVGALLPTELELCEQFGTSRHTVRAALQELQQLGFVSRRKNVGTRVESSRPTGAYQALATVDDLALFGATHVRVVRNIQQTVVDLDTARELGCVGGSRWLQISSLRMDEANSGEPIGWTDVYIEPGYKEVGDMIRAAPNTLISSLIETHYGRQIAHIQQEIHAVAVDAALAGELNVDAGTPALKIIRRYMDSSNQIFEISVSIHPADRFTFSMQLTRDARR